MKIIHNPIQEIILNNIVKIDIERITKIQAIASNPLGWVDGVLFYITEYDDEYFNKKQCDGTWFIDLFTYTECTKKPDSLKYNGFQVEVLDFTGYSIFEELIKSVLEMRVK